jgi:hypothetical protein
MKKISSIAKFLLPLLVLTVIVASAVTATRAADPQDKFVYLPIARGVMDTPRWIGPEGGTVNVLLTDPAHSSVLYAGTRGTGVFKSTNSGATWSASNTNISNLTIDSLAIDPSDAAIMYAGTEGQGVYKSTDSGATWSAINTNIKANSIVLALAVNPGNHDLIYAATQTQGTSNGVLYKTWDRGANWSAVLTQTNNWVNSLAVNPNKPNYILAATQNNGPYIATGYGSSGDWKSTSISAGDWQTGMWVMYDPQSGNDMAYYASKNNDFYQSTNLGANWTQKSDGTSTTIVSRNGLAINPFNRTIFYKAASSSATAGVFRSTNQGSDWSAAGLLGKKVNSVVVSRANVDTVFAGLDQEGVYKSTNRGTNWTKSTTGLGSSNVTGLVFSSATKFYASTYGGGLFSTTNGGASWSNYDTSLSDVLINGLVQHPTLPNIFYALTSSAGLKRYDMNASASGISPAGIPEFFDKPNIPLRADPATAAATVAAGINDMAFAPSSSGDIAYLATNGGGVYASTDSGLNFSQKGLAGEVVKSIIVNETNPNIVYASTSTLGVVKKSIDGGTFWNNIPLPDTQLQQPINVVTMLPGATDTVCAGTNNGVWKYNGTTWDAIGLQGYTIKVLVSDPVHPGFLVAGTNKGAFFSPDNQHWFAVDSNLSTYGIASINFSTFEKGTVYIGTMDHGTLRTGY